MLSRSRRVFRKPSSVSTGALILLSLFSGADAKLFNAVAVLEAPFVLNDTAFVPSVSQQQVIFSGIVIELLQAVVDRANRVFPLLSNDTLQLNISAVEDGEYGAQYPNGSWSGAIGSVLRGEAAVGIGIFTVNSARLTAGVHFSTPFLSTGLGVVVRQEDAPPETWYFLVPFTPEVWMMILTTVVIACVSAWALDRLSPYGYYWSSADPEDRRVLNLTNSLYGGLLTLTRKTPVRGAKAVSSRVVMISMYFMAFFMLNSYIAALTALIAVRETTTTINSWTDIRDRRLPFGVIAGSASVDFFASSSDAGIRGMSSQMRQYRTVAAGLAAVRSGALPAFIADLQTLQFEILQPPCNLQVVGPTMDTHFLAFIFNETTFNPPFLLKPIIDSGIVTAIDDNTISRLYANYFATSGTCADISVPPSPKGLLPQQLGGVAYTFLIALGLALAMLLFERLVYTQRNGKYLWIRKLNKALGLVYWKMRPASGDFRKVDLKFTAGELRGEDREEGPTGTLQQH